MESPKKLRNVNGSRIAVLLVLLGCASVGAWSQDFETNGNGWAKACTDEQSYNDPSGGRVSASCSNSSGYASSFTTVDFSIIGVAGSITVLNGHAIANTTTFDIATLIPPAGDDKTDVTFTAASSLGYTVTGNANVYWCIYAGTIKSDCGTFSSGTGTPILTKSVTVTKSSSGFQFPFRTVTKADAGGNKKAPFASAQFGGPPDPLLTLPEGWTCTWASGYVCP